MLMCASDHLRRMNINREEIPKWATYVNIFHSIYDAAFFDPFNESVAGSVIRDGQSEGIFTLGDFNLLWSSCIHIAKRDTINPSGLVLLVEKTSVIPFLWAKIKSSNPICPPSNLFMSTLWVLSVQKRI